jgi:hypothetical protein
MGSKRMRCSGLVALKVEMRSASKILVGKLKERERLEDVDEDEHNTKMSLGNSIVWQGLGWSGGFL